MVTPSLGAASEIPLSRYIEHSRSRVADPGVPRRIVIIKWDALQAEALRTLCLRAFPEANVVSFQCATRAVAALEAEASDLTLTGLTFEERDVFPLLEQLRRRSGRVLIVSGRRDDLTVQALRKAPFDGWVDPHAIDLAKLPEIMTRVIKGERVIDERLRRCLSGGQGLEALRHRLTSAELRVLVVIGDGSDDREAATKLGLSVATVRTHRRSILGKLNVPTSAKMVYEAFRLGVVRTTRGGCAVVGELRR